jgi:hypothetical protein
MVCQRLAQRQAPLVFGVTHPTPDGTCIRDFVHVADIATAHVTAARALGEGTVTALNANIGRGEGVSVRQMVDTIRAVTGTADEAWAEPVIAPPRRPRPGRRLRRHHLHRPRAGGPARRPGNGRLGVGRLDGDPGRHGLSPPSAAVDHALVRLQGHLGRRGLAVCGPQPRRHGHAHLPALALVEVDSGPPVGELP